MVFTVQISKAYFPEGSQPAKYKFTDVWDEVRVQASSRTEAAKKAWVRHGARWHLAMKSKETSVRHVSLNVSDPERGAGGFAGRLSPIRVFTEALIEAASSGFWYHGTSGSPPEMLTPGMESRYKKAAPRVDSVYVTSNVKMARWYSREASRHTGEPPVILKVRVNASRLVIDEDVLNDCLQDGDLRDVWYEWISGSEPHWRGMDPEEAYALWSENLPVDYEAELAFRMKEFADWLYRKKPPVNKRLVKKYGMAAHIGPVKVAGVLSESLTEVASTPFPYVTDVRGNVLTGNFSTHEFDYVATASFRKWDDGSSLSLDFIARPKGHRSDHVGTTHEGVAGRVLATVFEIFSEAVGRFKPDSIYFSGTTTQRTRLFAKLAVSTFGRYRLDPEWTDGVRLLRRA